MLNHRCFGTFHRPLVTATQISLAMDCESRDVLMPEVREKISDTTNAFDRYGLSVLPIWTFCLIDMDFLFDRYGLSV